MLRLFRIHGQSMAPSLCDGAIGLVARWPRQWLREKMLVVVQVAESRWIVKRIAAIDDAGRVVLASDNPATTSRYCGVAIPMEQVRGRLLVSL